ncbi:MAG: TPM domain-containing protein [Lachnospiraceae bacterium]|nr:TPM domain-containing protein [Lachnospiraceae bacterium]
MKKYIKSMAVFLIIIAVLLAIYLALWGMKYAVGETYVRKNSVAPAQRVYDYADVLTDSEEKDLEKLIAKREGQIGCDIVLVIINEPLAEYARGYEDVLGHLSESEYVMVYADNFYDEKAFGYNAPHGNGCVFVDNWDRSDSIYGYAYNWLSTSGTVEDKFSTRMINRVIDDVNDRVNENPYEAYKSYVNNIYYYMSGNSTERVVIPLYVVAGIAAIAAVIYLIGNLAKNIGTKTTVGNTYVNGGRPKMNVMTDQFVRKSVTKRRIQSSSGGGGGGGGGGHHTSAGGHSHGGGGGHH